MNENGDLLEDTNHICGRRKNYFSQLLNVHDISAPRQIEVHAVEKLVPGPSHLAVETAIEKVKKSKSRCSDQISAELIQVGSETLLSEIHKNISRKLRLTTVGDPPR
jgi:hypothetical protein